VPEVARRTKIVATIGPASSTPETLSLLAHAGMDGARLNLSHGPPLEKTEQKEQCHHRGRAEAPLAPRVDDERLERREPGREQHAPQRQHEHPRGEQP